MTLTRTYYNEYDPFAADWLESLIHSGSLPPGDVDRRSLLDVRPADLIGYQHCHFFAGIGGWALSQMWSGWPDTLPLWTGSCPCQPYSAAGKQKGADDHRDLWPSWFRLLQGTNHLRSLAGLPPIPVVAGEQVEGAIRHGWWDRLQADMEGEGYACGMGVLGAHSVGAFHLRQRMYWVAQSGLALAACECLGGGGDLRPGRGDESPDAGTDGRLGDPHGPGPQGRDLRRHGGGECPPRAGSVAHQTFWSSADWLPCRDGKLRPVEPGTFPLAHGVPARVGRLRGYGNAIVPQLGAEVLRTYLETLTEWPDGR